MIEYASHSSKGDVMSNKIKITSESLLAAGFEKRGKGLYSITSSSGYTMSVAPEDGTIKTECVVTGPNTRVPIPNGLCETINLLSSIWEELSGEKINIDTVCHAMQRSDVVRWLKSMGFEQLPSRGVFEELPIFERPLEEALVERGIISVPKSLHNQESVFSVESDGHEADLASGFLTDKSYLRSLYRLLQGFGVVPDTDDEIDILLSEYI